MEPVNFRITGSVRGSLPSIPTSSTNLPSLDAEFSGRAADLALLGDALRTAPVTVVSGLAGVGKTTLALKAAREFGGRALFVDLDEIAALPLLLAGLGVPQEEIPADQSAQEVLYRSRLAAEQEPVLVFLDNATSAAQVRGLLPGSPRHRVLITSRHTLAELNARLIELDVLTVDEAIDLVTAALVARRPDDPRTPTGELVQLADRLPLALSIVAAVLADDTTLPVDELTGLLRPPTDRLDELDGVRRAFDLSYSRLTAAQRRLFRLLSVVPVAEVAVGHACALLDGKTRSVQKLLASLRRAHLVEHGRARGRFRMHDLLRLYSAEQAVPEREDAWDRLADHLVQLSHAASAQLDREAVEWLDLEWPLLTNVVDRSFELGRHDHVVALVRRISRFTHLRSGWREWPRLHELGLTSAQELEDRWLEGVMQGQTGNMHYLSENLAAAESCYAAAMKIFRELGDEEGQVATTFNLANLTWQNGNPRAAKTALNRVLKIRTAADAEGSAARTLFSLGCIAHEQGNLDKAYEHLTTAWSMFEATGDRHAIAMVLNAMGLVLKDSGRDEVALSVFQKAKKHARQSSDVPLEARATANTALVHGLMGDTDTAVTVFRQAMELFGQAGEEDEVGNVARIVADLDQSQPR